MYFGDIFPYRLKTAAFLPANNRASLHLSTRRDYVEEKNVIENQIKIISTVVKFYIDELYVGKKMRKKKIHFSHVDHSPLPTHDVGSSLHEA